MRGGKVFEQERGLSKGAYYRRLQATTGKQRNGKESASKRDI